MTRPVYRFAPSPNGELHLGHAYSALLNWRMAQESNGRFLLRMEDTDQTRCRPGFDAGIRRDLAWLGLSWEEPVRVQSQHMPEYRHRVSALWEKSAAYPCFCSRKRVAAESPGGSDPDGQPLYAGTCRSLPRGDAEASIEGGAPHAWRLDMRQAVDRGAQGWGDVVIARFGTGSSYHVAVVHDDAEQGITHVVRGKDLELSMPIHLHLQSVLGLPHPHYHHHDLILGSNGEKLSKSLRSTSLAALRANGVRAPEIWQRLGFDPPSLSEV